MALPKGLLELLKSDRSLALFVGAGISVKAGIPAGPCVIQILKKRYPKKLKKPADEYAYSEAFKEALPGKKHRAERRRLFEELCAGKAPADEHHLIAHLVDHQKFPLVFTTNFDQLTEIALSIRCSPQPQVYMYDEDIEPLEYSVDVPKLVKLHGDFLFDDIANLEDELRRRLDENMRSKLLNYLRDRGLIVVGCGGNDKTIMKFLEAVAESPEGMKDGLWWVIYKENDRTKRLTDLISKTRENGKPAEIVGPIHARKFFRTVCESMRLTLPEPIPFGITPGDKTLITRYTQRFGRARQLPPLDVPEKLDTHREALLHKLETAAESSGVICLSGPPQSGKSTIIGKLAKRHPRRLFYFSHRFAHRPVQLSLILDLERFATGFGIPVLGREQFLEWLFSKDVVLVFDDLFSTNCDMENEFLDELRRIIFIREIVRRGNIVLVADEQKKMLDWINCASYRRTKPGKSGRITKIHLRSAVVKLESGRSTRHKDSETRRVLAVMSLLRFAELPEILSRLCHHPGIQTTLDILEQDKLVERRGRRYILRANVQTFFRTSESKPETYRTDLAKRFEAISRDSPFFRRAHYGLEAEHHYWQARRVRQALTLLIEIEHTPREAGQGLREYFRAASTTSVLSRLSPWELLRLLRLSYEALQEGSIALDEFSLVDEEVQADLSERGEGYLDLLEASWNYHHRKDLEGYKRSLLKARKKFRASDNTKDLAKVLFDLSVFAFQRMGNVFDKRRIKGALSWARKAEEASSTVRDRKGVAKARDHIAKIMLALGDYTGALRLEKKQRDVHAADEGFTSEKAVVYGNLFMASLELRHIKEAEGYFHQSNLNFAWVRDRMGILRNLFNLGNWLTSSGNLDMLFSGYSVSATRKEEVVQALAQCIRTLEQDVFYRSGFTEFLKSGRRAM